jgi:hypothetical protein
MAGWVYETTCTGGTPGIWMLGWDNAVDARVAASVLRHGNVDYLTNTVNWDPTITNHTLPNSLYLTQKPAFFGNNPWPWVDPTAGAYTLPAKARYDAGTPLL